MRINIDKNIKKLFLASLLLGCSTLVAAQVSEPPALADRVASGELQPMQDRLPDIPFVDIHAANQEAKYGGTMRLLLGKSKDIRQMVVYGYARLVGYNRDLELTADILEDFTVEEGRIFTFYLRKGHRWSDGQPFTAEDFSYYWNDIANNESLSPFGPAKVLLVDDKPPKFEMLDQWTVRYTWDKPNPNFLTSLAEPSPRFIYAPKHYLKQFHEKYNDTATLNARVKKSGRRNWVSLHHFLNRQYKSDNPELPVLQPWINTTRPPAERFVFIRNPWFHRIDTLGRQLPYIDEVAIHIVDKSLISAKTSAGETDLQGRYIYLTDYTFLKQSEDRADYKVYLWSKGTGSQTAIYPNLNSQDPVWRGLVRDVRFRRALSLGINRHEVNQVIYFGLARESNNTVLTGSPLYQASYQNDWAEFDIDKANQLLDDMGLDKRNDRDLRLMPDARPLEVILHTSGESTEETDVLELIGDGWLKLGIKLFVSPSQREVFRERIFTGSSMISMFSGIDNGLPTPTMSPSEFVPVQQNQLQWPKWGQYYETGGERGEVPDLPEAQKLVELYQQWQSATSYEEKQSVWRNILELQTEQVFTIGLINGVPQPIVISNRLKGAPEKGIYSWSPTSYFGIYHPDSFWIDE